MKRITLAVLVGAALFIAACDSVPTMVEPEPELTAQDLFIIERLPDGRALRIIPIQPPGWLAQGPRAPGHASFAPAAPMLLMSTIAAGDKGGADVTPADGDVLEGGTYTNVGTFHIADGSNVRVAPGAPLVIFAEHIVIDGVLDASGAGFAGGAASAGEGNPGEGDGGGDGAVIGSCLSGSGGGGGYGGTGGNGATLVVTDVAQGGATYGQADPPGIEPGSGGGSAAAHDPGCWDDPGVGGAGGAGGGAVHLAAKTITVTGAILADGDEGHQGTPGDFLGSGEPLDVSGGGGGAGGGVWLDGALSLNGALLSAVGGTGGDASGPGPFFVGTGQGGGGGGGGRIKLSGCHASTPLYAVSVAGGPAGPSYPGFFVESTQTDGEAGTSVDAADAECPEEDEVITRDDCMKGGWEQFGFRNQGQCIRFVETGKDSRE